jgi:Cas6b C-terminal domain/Cas6b N-terminal domain
MHPLTITTLQTNIPIEHNELEAAKKALGTWLKKKGFAQHGFIHNHENEEDPDYKTQAYPQVQLRCPNGRLMLWGINEGAQALQQLMLKEMLRGFQFRGTQCRMVAAQTGTEQYALDWLPRGQSRHYELNYFIALKPGNFEAWQKMSAPAKMQRLEDMLANSLAMFCKTAGWPVDKEKLQARIYWVWHTRWVKFKEQRLLAFTLNYTCNLQLPDGIALGRKVKLGYGWQTARPGPADGSVSPE